MTGRGPKNNPNVVTQKLLFHEVDLQRAYQAGILSVSIVSMTQWTIINPSLSRTHQQTTDKKTTLPPSAYSGIGGNFRATVCGDAEPTGPQALPPHLETRLGR
jgi:hypothetical protein